MPDQNIFDPSLMDDPASAGFFDAPTPDDVLDIVMLIDPETGEEITEGESAGTPFDANLAESMEKPELNEIAEELYTAIESDIRSKSEWERIAAEGVRRTAVSEEDAGTENGSNVAQEWQSKLTHPLLFEAIVRFQSQAAPEIFPPTGPGKADVFGDDTEDLREKAERKAQFTNYCYTKVMNYAADQFERQLFVLAREGSTFTRLTWDPVLKRPVRRFFKAEDFILPNQYDSFHECPRYTVKIPYHINKIRRAQDKGFFVKDWALGDGRKGTDPGDSESDQIVDNAVGEDDSGGSDLDEIHDVYESHATITLPERIDGGEPGPYIVHLDKETKTIGAIYRNWREGDENREQRVWDVDWSFIPGDGVYAMGLNHMIGQLSDAATGSLRALMDAAQLSNMKAKLLAGDINVDKMDTSPLAPGEMRPVKFTGEDLRKSVVDINFSEPSNTMVALLGMIIEAGQKFASTADLMTGDADHKAPVGTTVALLEQGSKVYSAIHGRLYRSMAREMALFAEIISEHVDDDATYPIPTLADRRILDDFDDTTGLDCVADPRIFSRQQRIAIDQSIMALAQQYPQLYDQEEINRTMLRTIGVQDIDRLLISQRPPRLDAISENMVFMAGGPVGAFIDQNHEAHIAVHQHWFMGLEKEFQSQLRPAVMGHIGEHMAYAYRAQMMQALGVPLPPAPDLHASRPDRIVKNVLPPEIEAQIDEAAAMAVMQQQPQLPNPGAEQKSPEQIKAEMKAKIDAEEAAAKEQRRQEEFVREEERKQVSFRAEEMREDEAFNREQARKAVEAAAAAEREAEQRAIDALAGGDAEG